MCNAYNHRSRKHSGASHVRFSSHWLRRRPGHWFALGCRETGVKIYHEPPSVTITSPSDGTNYYAGESIEFIALVQSTGDDLTDLTHEWMAGSDLICESAPVPADGQPNCVHAFTDTGVQSVEITVTDTRLDRASASSTVNILDNEPPLITIVSPEEGDLFSIDDLIVFEAAVSDAEESPENLRVRKLQHRRRSRATGTPSSSGEWTAGGYLTSGVHLLTFWVEDSFGLSDQDTVSIEVYAHGPPSATSSTSRPHLHIHDLAADVQGWTDMEETPSSADHGTSRTNRHAIEDSSETTGSFPYGKTTRGDLVQVEVTPYNAYGDGDTLSSPTIAIENSPVRPSCPLPPLRNQKKT